MKKQKFLAPLAVPAVVLAGGLFGGNAFATGGTPGVLLFDMDKQPICSYYISTGDDSALCDATQYGSYSNGVLNLAEGADGNFIWVEGAIADNVTIKSDADLSAAIYSESNLTLDFGANELTVPNLKSIQLGANAKTLTIDSGAITVPNPVSIEFDTLIINNGSFNVSKDLAVNNITVNGGELSLDGASLRVGKKMEVKGGEININQDDISGAIQLVGSNALYNQTAGNVNITGEGSVTSTGISGNGAPTITVSGGNLNIKKVSRGIDIAGNNSKINFNGGKTVIEDSQSYAIYIKGLNDPENGIAFGEDMGIAEKNVVVNWLTAEEDEYGISSTGIVRKNGTVTIEEGHTVKKVKGWDIGDLDGDDDEDAPGSAGEDEESDVKVPDTGTLEDAKTSGALSIFAASTFILLSVIALATAHKKHAAGHFKFDNK